MSTAGQWLCGILYGLGPDEITAFFTAIIGITGIWALAYASRQLKESKRQAQIQHLVTFCRDFASEPLVTFRACAARQWLRGDKYSSELVEVVNFFEQVGLLVSRGYLDRTDAWEMFSSTVFPLFLSCKAQIESDRLEDLNAFSHFVALYYTFTEIERNKSGKAYDQNKEEIKEFWKEEQKAKPGTPIRRRQRIKKTGTEASASDLL